MLPPKPDFAAVAEAATRAETNLLRWFDYTPEPSLEQLDVSSKVIWRLAAVRKTLSLVGSKTKRLIGQVPKQLTQTMQEIDRLMVQLAPPKPPRPAPPPSSLKPLPPLPSLPPLPPLYPHESNRQPRELAPRAARAETEKDAPHPVAVCPELQNPLHTVQAAERQVNQLCKEAGIPAPTPEPPTPAPQTSSPAPVPPTPAPGTAPATAQPTPHPTYTPSTPHKPYPSDPAEIKAYLDSVTDIGEFLAFVGHLEERFDAEVAKSQSAKPPKRPPPT
jgi:hypothetical protein